MSTALSMCACVCVCVRSCYLVHAGTHVLVSLAHGDLFTQRTSWTRQWKHSESDWNITILQTELRFLNDCENLSSSSCSSCCFVLSAAPPGFSPLPSESCPLDSTWTWATHTETLTDTCTYTERKTSQPFSDSQN